LNAEQKFVSLNLPGMRYFPAPTKTKAAQKSGCCQVLLRFRNMLSLAQASLDSNGRDLLNAFE
jgi:hypothetical protein